MAHCRHPIGEEIIHRQHHEAEGSTMKMDSFPSASHQTGIFIIQVTGKETSASTAGGRLTIHLSACPHHRTLPILRWLPWEAPASIPSCLQPVPSHISGALTACQGTASSRRYDEGQVKDAQRIRDAHTGPAVHRGPAGHI